MVLIVTRRASLAPSAGFFGRYIREVRQRRKLRVRIAAERAGISVAYLEQLESGKRAEPSLSVLVALANAYGMGPKLLLTAWLAGTDAQSATATKRLAHKRAKIARFRGKN